MIGLDTHILVRYILQDNDSECPSINREVEKHDSLFINNIVLIEFCAILRHKYGYKKNDISHLLHKMLVVENIVFEDRDAVRMALYKYDHNEMNISDALISCRNASMGCTKTISIYL